MILLHCVLDVKKGEREDVLVHVVSKTHARYCKMYREFTFIGLTDTLLRTVYVKYLSLYVFHRIVWNESFRIRRCLAGRRIVIKQNLFVEV